MFLISQISGIVFMLRHFDFALFLKGPFKRDVYEKGLVFGLMLFPLTLFTTLSATIDRTMIAAISGFEEVAAYSLAFRLIMPAMVVITGSVMLVLFPYIAAQWRPGQYMKAGVYHFTGLRLSAFLTLLFFVFLVLLSLFMHFPGIDSYLGAYKKTFLLLPFLGIMPLIECLFVSASNLLQIMNRTKGLLLAMPFFVVINVLLNYLLIPAYGAFGAAAATLAGYLSAAAGANVLLYRAIKKDKLKINIRIYLKPAFYGGLIIISGLGAVLSAILARPWGWPWGYLYVPAAILVYSVCFVLLLLRAGFIRPGDMRKLGGL
jgi:O-antigen/teichoic acid export membrane protein